MKIVKFNEYSLNESEQIDFPIKKFLYIVKSKIDGEIKEGRNLFEMDFLNEKSLPVKFTLNINYTKSNTLYNYSGGVRRKNLKETNFNGFFLSVKITDKKVDYEELYSVIGHELKHVYDIYHDINTESFDNFTNYFGLETKYKDNEIFSQIIHLCYLGTIHELEARNSMLYNKLRWLKTYDKKQILDEFKKTYTYRELLELRAFDHKKLIELCDKTELFDFTKDLINSFYKHEIDSDFNLVKFYSNLETNFKNLAKEYLIKAFKVVDEIIIDNKPYMEKRVNILFTESELQTSIDKLFGTVDFFYNSSIVDNFDKKETHNSSSDEDWFNDILNNNY